ncbi:MAG: sporulation transcriptional regulator SpoIIID [Vallitaleaceae bacterium]|nr:sporulation transcriptional regulator SpoIIID [Vallitaleaceae bacterium]
MKQYIEERAIDVATYIIEANATVRQTAKKFGISKSTVHTDVTNVNGGKWFLWWDDGQALGTANERGRVLL